MSQTILEKKESTSNIHNIPSLFKKLCSHFAKNDQALAAHLFKLSLRFITLSNSEESVDEQYVVTKIRKFLSSNNEASVKSFDVLYTKLNTMTLIRNKGSILQLFFELTPKRSSLNLDLADRVLLQEATSAITIGNSNSNFTFLPDETKGGSVKKLYSVKSGRMISAQSSQTQLNQGASSSFTWTNSEHDVQIYKDPSSSHCSSRSALTESLSENSLMHEVIYCLQGIEGKILRKEPGGLGFSIDLKASKVMSPVHKGLVERLANVGFLHNQIKNHCDEPDRHIGLIGQALISILADELTSYYHLVSMLHAQLSKQGSSLDSKLTLRRMIVWVAEPQLRLQWLAYIAEECTDQKGGALISAVDMFMHHGSLCAQTVAAKVLSAVCRPLYVMLSKWLLNGELKDPCGEFFIETRNIANNIVERLWHDKYHVRKAMIPSFITMEQARKILATGKSINFLRQVCRDNEELPGRDALQKLFSTTTAEALFSSEESIQLHDTLESVYKETSLRVLNLLKEKYNMLEHLQALRRYLLLGQGDFIRHLLELIAPELNKRGEHVFNHTLAAILETAVRATNAQYEDEDILKRLHVVIAQPSKQDIGWDVFTLMYAIDGPVGTIFQPTMQIYKSLFGVLWNAKRMEYVLSNLRKQQISSSKLFRKISELKPITHLLHICSSEMIHFLHQTQYYFLFEIIECSWAEMIRRVNQAECLDDVITAHNAFLKSVESGMLLNPSTHKLVLQLRSIFNTILQLEATQDCLFSAASRELEARTKYEYKYQNNDPSEMDAIEKENVLRNEKFNGFLKVMKKQVKGISEIYSSHVKKFLNSLATNSDLNLQLLSVRLNFNDYYNVI